MPYTHRTTEELVRTEAYFHQNVSVLNIAIYVGCSRQTIHNVVVTFLRKAILLLITLNNTKKIRNVVVDALLLYHMTNKNTFK